jgi:hypothetical protein
MANLAPASIAAAFVRVDIHRDRYQAAPVVPIIRQNPSCNAVPRAAVAATALRNRMRRKALTVKALAL